MSVLPGVPEDKRPSTLGESSLQLWEVTHQSRSLEEIFGVGPPARKQREGASYAPPVIS